MATYLADSLFEDDDLEPIDVAFEVGSAELAPDGSPIDEVTGLPMLSRRTMLGGFFASALAAGGMMMLPKERGGVLFAGFSPFGAEKAYASSIWSGKFSFEVVGADEVGIQIMDVSGLSEYDEETIEKKGTPVKNATVALVSRHNDYTVSGKTDDEGKVILPLKSLSFSVEKSDGVYRCNCKISVTTEDARVKMRDFSTGRVCLEGATGYIIGTHKADDTAVYMERCSFDEWDIHYSKLTFLRSKVNDDEHTIYVRIKGAASDVKASMEVLDASKKKTLLKKRTALVTHDPKSGNAECYFRGYFLWTGSDDCFTEDDVVIRITLTSGNTPYVTDLEMFIEDTPFDDAKLGKPILPITTDPTSVFSFKAEAPNKKKWPVFNGLGFSVLSPFPLVQVSTTIITTSVGFGTDVRMVADEGGWAPKGNWKQDHKGNIKQRYQNLLDRKKSELAKRQGSKNEVEMQDMEEPGNPDHKEPQATSKTEKFLNCQLNIIARIALLFNWDGFGKSGEWNHYSGEGTFEVGFSVSGTFTVEFSLGPLPAYLSITLGMTALGAFSVAMTHEQQRSVKELDVSEMGWTLDKSAGLLLKFVLAASLGIGYKGLVSLSFDATFAFPIYFGWLQEGGEGKSNPHTTVGVTILLEVVLQALLFRLSGQIFSYSDNAWYDNWSEDSSASVLTGEDAWAGIEPRFRLTHGDGTLRHTLSYDNEGNLLRGNAADPFVDAVPTTDAMMLNTREANARKRGGNAGALTDAEYESLKERRIAAFVPVEGASGVFQRAANAAEGLEQSTAVFVGKMPKAVLQDDGSVVTKLVVCEGANTFYFGEVTPEMLSAASSDVETDGASTRPVKGVAADTASAAEGSVALMAGTIAAQDGDPRFEGDKMLGFALGASREYDYDAVAGKTTGEPCGPSGVSGVGTHDGVVPKVNAIIYKDVHSDPRQRVVSIGGTLYLFRVATVQYPDAIGGGYCRSRVVASKFDEVSQTWGEPTVLEYDSGDRDLPRVSIYDYEFDIAVRTGKKKWTQEGEACLIVTGGLRPEGDSTTFHDAACSGTVALLVIDADLNVLQRSVNRVKQSAGAGFFADSQEHLACSPVIVDGFAPDGASGSLAFAFLRRSAASKLALAGAEASVTFCVGHCYVRDGYLSLPFELKEGPSLAADVYGVRGVAGSAVAGKYDALFTLLLNHQQGYDVCAATIPSGGDFGSLQITHCIASTDKLPEIQPWPHHGTFLFVKERPTEVDSTEADYHLYAGTFDASASGQKGFGAEQVDMAGIKGASFCVSPSGEFIFYFESYRDKPNTNPAANFTSSTVTGTGDDSVRHIMASRLIDGKFCEDFPFCELDHPIDHFEVLELSDGTTSFVATHITDFDNSVADLHYIGVPNALAAEIEAFVQTIPFVCAGHKASFSMDVRNHGNQIISGFEVQMLDPDRGGMVVGAVDVGEIDPDKIALTAANMGWGHTASEAPQLTDQEKQGWLMPGKLISYPAEFDIPEDWEGNKTVIMRISKAKTPKTTQLNVQASAEVAAAAGGFTEEADGMVVQAVENGVHHFYMAKSGGITLTDSAQGNGAVYDPDEWTGTRPSLNPDDPSKNGGNSGKGAGTGDNLGAFGSLAIVAAGASALAVGYSARRLQNEREAREAKQSEGVEP